MKKLVGFIVVTAICFSAFAQFNLTKNGTLSLQLYSLDPLYEESFSDPYSFNARLSYDFALDLDKRPTEVLCVVKNGNTLETSYEFLPIQTEGNYLEDDSKTYINMKPAIALSLLRFEYENTDSKLPKLQAELNVNGYINTVFCGFGRNDTLDFDGSYFIGATVKADNKYSLRVGLHHFSGHYGDEMLEKLYATNNIDFSQTLIYEDAPYGAKIGDTEKYFLEPVEYVRDNSWLISASADVADYFRFYGSLEIPKNPSWLRPLAHCPANYKNPVSKTKDPTMIERIGTLDRDDGEHFEDSELDVIEAAKDSSYKALRAQLGAEFEYEFKDFVFFASADLQLHQDGKTAHDPYGYKKDAAWDREVSIAAGVQFKSVIPGKSVAIEGIYHNGRFNATQWFYQDYESFSIGIIVK